MFAAFRRMSSTSGHPAAAFRGELARLIRARSTWGACIVIASITIALAALVASFVGDAGSPAPHVVFALLTVSMLTVGICGVGAPPIDVREGTAPDSGARILVAWAAAFAAVVFALALATYTVTALVVFDVAARRGMVLASEGIGTPVAIVAAALATALVGVIGLGIGALFRSRIHGIAATVGLLFLLPLIVSFAYLLLGKQEWVYEPLNILPLAVAKNVVLVDEPGTAQFPRLVALLVLIAWAAAALSAVRLRRRWIARQPVDGVGECDPVGRDSVHDSHPD